MEPIYYRNLHHKARAERRHEGVIEIRVANGRAYVRMPRDGEPDPDFDYVVIEEHPLCIVVGIDEIRGDETGYIKAGRPKVVNSD